MRRRIRIPYPPEEVDTKEELNAYYEDMEDWIAEQEVGDEEL